MPKGDNNRKLFTDDIERAIVMYTTPMADGTWMSASKIAREFGVSVPALLRQLRLHGVAIRSMSETQSGKQYKPRKDRGKPPPCKCGCGQYVTSYDRGRKRWRPYLSGHYYQLSTGSYRRHPRHPGIQSEINNAIRDRDLHACRLCGASTVDLHVHHIDGDHTHNSSNNLITLCIPCHNLAHSSSSQNAHLLMLANTPSLL